MERTSVPRQYAFAGLFALPGLFFSTAAVSQIALKTSTSTLDAPAYNSVDANSVDTLTGRLAVQTPVLNVGAAKDGKSFAFSWTGRQWAPNLPAIWIDKDWHVFVQSPRGTDEFANPVVDNSWTQGGGVKYNYSHIRPGKGAVLACLITGGISGQGWFDSCWYTRKDGMTILFGGPLPNNGSFPANNQYDWEAYGNIFTWPFSVSDPAGKDGMALYIDSIGNQAQQYQTLNAGPRGGGIYFTTSDGYYFQTSAKYNSTQINFSVKPHRLSQSSAIQTIGVTTPNLNATNKENTYLRPKNTTQTWTDSSLNSWSFTFNGNGDIVQTTTPTGVTRSYTYDGSHRVSTATSALGTWVYSYDFSDTSTGAGTTTVTDPLGGVTRVQHQRKPGPVSAVIDQFNQTTSYAYNSLDQITTVASPEGSYRSFAYDSFGNVTSVTSYPKTGSLETPTVTLADYAAQCLTGATCHQPTTITDPRTNVTTYGYDAAGRGTSAISAAAGNSGVASETRSTYRTVQVFYLDAGGTPQSVSGPTVLATTKTCRTSANCAGTSDEVVREFGYATAYTPSSAANNGLPVSETVKLGDGTILQTSLMSYDAVGNLTVIDGPRTDIDDRSYKTYDLLRRPVFEISADPDASGPLARTVVRHVYNADGQETLTEYGYGNATDGSDFTVQRSKRMTYSSATGALLRTEEVTP